MYKKSKFNKRTYYSKTRIYLLIILLLITVISILILKADFFSVKSIVVFNNYHISDEEIIAYSEINNSQNIFKLKISEVAENIINHPFIKNAEIKRNYPNEIIIDIEERNKIAAISHMGIFFLVDNEGYILKITPQISDEILVEGFEINSFIEGDIINISDNDALNSSLELSSLIKEWNSDISPKIEYKNDTIELYINDNFKVKFGNGEDIHTKFNIFLNIYDDLKEKNIYNGIIDLSHSGYPIYRPFGE